MASAAGPQNSGNVNYFFHIIVFLCITFLFGKLDPIAPLTPFGMNTIGVFLGVIYAWVFIDIIWPSMVGLLALMLLDVLPATALLNKGFGDPTVIMMMFIFVFSATLERYGLAKYISLWFVSRKCVMGKPWRLTFALLLAIAILGGLTSAGIQLTVAALRKAGLYIPYKASLTPTNKDWTVCQLFSEIYQEHQAMHSRQERVHTEE